VLFQWHWYYHTPALPLWAIILLLLVVPKANRHRQAWLILIPLGLVLIVWRMPATLLSMPGDAAEILGFFVVSTAMAWSTVWLLGHWLASRYRFITFLLSLATMLAVGLLSYYSHFADGDNLVSLLTSYGLGVGILLLAMGHTAYLCRKNYSPQRFLGRLIGSNVLVAMGLLLAFLVISTLVMMVINPRPQLDASDLMIPAIMTIVGSVFLAGILYLLNLPFLILAFKNPFYGTRFETLFRIEKDRTDLKSPPEQQVL
jgi:hypothetical protein